MSDTATMTVVTWLRACFDEDEAAARSVQAKAGEDIRPYLGDGTDWLDAYAERHNPASILVDIAAKRRILDEYTESASRTVAHGAPSNAEVRTAALADVIQILAEAYADRPGWREEWRQ